MWVGNLNLNWRLEYPRENEGVKNTIWEFKRELKFQIFTKTQNRSSVQVWNSVSAVNPLAAWPGRNASTLSRNDQKNYYSANEAGFTPGSKTPLKQKLKKRHTRRILCETGMLMKIDTLQQVQHFKAMNRRELVRRRWGNTQKATFTLAVANRIKRQPLDVSRVVILDHEINPHA